MEPRDPFSPAADADAARRQIYDDKLEALAEAINGLAPDVLALQEVGDRQRLGTSAIASAGD